MNQTSPRQQNAADPMTAVPTNEPSPKPTPDTTRVNGTTTAGQAASPAGDETSKAPTATAATPNETSGEVAKKEEHKKIGNFTVGKSFQNYNTLTSL